jgi:uncharacterized membrane protein YqjE
MDTAPPSVAHVPGLGALPTLGTLRHAGGAMIDHLALHGSLIGVELQQEKLRLTKMLQAAVVGLASVICLLIALGAFLLLAVWDTPYRLHAAAALVLVYGLATLGAWRAFQAGALKSQDAFALSRENLAADLRLFRNPT